MSVFLSVIPDLLLRQLAENLQPVLSVCNSEAGVSAVACHTHPCRRHFGASEVSGQTLLTHLGCTEKRGPTLLVPVLLVPTGFLPVQTMLISRYCNIWRWLASGLSLLGSTWLRNSLQWLHKCEQSAPRRATPSCHHCSRYFRGCLLHSTRWQQTALSFCDCIINPRFWSWWCSFPGGGGAAAEGLTVVLGGSTVVRQQQRQ